MSARISTMIPSSARGVSPGLSPMESLAVMASWFAGALAIWYLGGVRTARYAMLHAPTVWLASWGIARCVGYPRGWGGRSPALAWVRAGLIAGGSAAAVVLLGQVFWPDRPFRRSALGGSAVLSALALGVGRGPLARWRLEIDGWLAGLASWTRRRLIAVLSQPAPVSRRAGALAVVLGVVLVSGSVGYTAYRSGFVPCALDCGETLEGYVAGLNHHRFGFHLTRGLMDIALDASPAGHPRLYVHQANLAHWLSAGARALGARELPAQSALMVLVYAAGLAYLFAFIRGTTGSTLFAGIVLVTVGTLYPLSTLWAFNLLRTPAWLLTFGPSYHAWRAGQGGRRARWHLAAAAVQLALGIGVDHAFAVSTGATIVALAALGVIGGGWRRATMLVVSSLAGAVAMHHALVISALGLGSWAGDLLDVAARRQALVGVLLRALEARTGWKLDASGPSDGSPAVRWIIPRQETDPVVAVADVGVAVVSVAGMVLLLGLAGWALAAAMLRGADWDAITRTGGRVAQAGSRLVGALLVGQGAAALLLTGYYQTFAGAHLFPQPVHAVVLVLALLAHVLVAHVRTAVMWADRRLPIGALALLGFVLLRAEAETANYRKYPPVGEPARDALVGLRGHSFVATTWGPGVAVYTHEWASALNRRGFKKFLADPVEDLVPIRDFHPAWQFRASLGEPGDPRYRRPELLLVSGGLPIPACQAHREGRLVQLRKPGCDPADVAPRLRHLPLHAEGPGYLIYDLRPVWAARDRDVGAPRR